MVVILLNKKSVTVKVIEYLISQGISISDMAEKLGFPEEKLSVVGEGNLSAAEFLEICNYLNIEPERFK